MSIIQAAEDFVKEKLDKEVVEHTLRVRNIAVKLAEEEGADKEIVELGALLHDIGYIKGFKNHDANGAPIAREFLNKQNYDLTKTGRIINCILRHGKSLKPEAIEEQIIWDADCLDRLGALGIIRMTKVQLKYNLCKPEESIPHLKTILENSFNNLHTKTAKQFARQLVPFQKKFFKELDKQLDIINNDFDFFYKIIKEA